jgi:hypothetical protein
MARRKPQPATPTTDATSVAPTATEVAATFDAAMALVHGQPTFADPEVESDNAKPSSVVKPAYKHRYAERAAASGLGKRAQRSCWDWLAQSLAGECLDDQSRISIDRFLTVLDLNGVDHSRWTNRSKGWEGRLRMTGRLALQRVVASSGVLKVEGDELIAPADWVAKHTH